MLVVAGMFLTSVVKAVNSPYAEIAKRNVFGLSAPVITVVAPTTKPLALPKITLTGITTILGRRMAFLTISAVKAGEAAESFMLAVGQGVNDIEVKNIDERAGVVSVVNHGESQILNFDRDGAKTPGPPNDPAPREPILPRPAPPSTVSGEAPLTPEEQVALIEIQRVKYQQENNSIHDILPPTEMTPATP
jgi:hypothetical protein